jgi:hypothetical protein
VFSLVVNPELGALFQFHDNNAARMISRARDLRSASASQAGRSTLLSLNVWMRVSMSAGTQ